VFAPFFIENPRDSFEGAKPDLQNHREIAEGAKIHPRGQGILGVLSKGKCESGKGSARTGSAERDKSRRLKKSSYQKTCPRNRIKHAVARPIIMIFKALSEGIFGHQDLPVRDE
jgi:hypothetical protein